VEARLNFRREFTPCPSATSLETRGLERGPSGADKTPRLSSRLSGSKFTGPLGAAPASPASTPSLLARCATQPARLTPATPALEGGSAEPTARGFPCLASASTQASQPQLRNSAAAGRSPAVEGVGRVGGHGKPGSEAWIRSLDQRPGSEAWIRSLDQKPGSEAWIRSLDQKPGSEASTRPRREGGAFRRAARPGPSGYAAGRATCLAT
jgi:hypothetical protein